MKLFFNGLGGALRGGLLGFGGFFVLGLIASLTSAHPITNLFGTLGVLVLLGGIVLGFISGVKEGKAAARSRAERQAAAQRLEQNLSNAFNTLNTASTSTPEGVERYGKACDFLLWAFSAYHSAPENSAVISKYRHLCYARTYPFYRWTNGRYQYVPGTELAEEIQKEFRRVTEEREVLFNKKY